MRFSVLDSGVSGLPYRSSFVGTPWDCSCKHTTSHLRHVAVTRTQALKSQMHKATSDQHATAYLASNQTSSDPNLPLHKLLLLVQLPSHQQQQQLQQQQQCQEQQHQFPSAWQVTPAGHPLLDPQSDVHHPQNGPSSVASFQVESSRLKSAPAAVEANGSVLLQEPYLRSPHSIALCAPSGKPWRTHQQQRQGVASTVHSASTTIHSDSPSGQGTSLPHRRPQHHHRETSQSSSAAPPVRRHPAVSTPTKQATSLTAAEAYSGGRTSPEGIMVDIKNCRSEAQLDSVLRVHSASLTPVHISAAITHLAQLSQRHMSSMQQQQQPVQHPSPHRSHSHPGDTQTSAVSHTTGQEDSPPWGWHRPQLQWLSSSTPLPVVSSPSSRPPVSQLAMRLCRMSLAAAHTFKARQVANTSWALAKLLGPGGGALITELQFAANLNGRHQNQNPTPAALSEAVAASSRSAHSAPVLLRGAVQTSGRKQRKVPALEALDYPQNNASQRQATSHPIHADQANRGENTSIKSQHNVSSLQSTSNFHPAGRTASRATSLQSNPSLPAISQSFAPNLEVLFAQASNRWDTFTGQELSNLLYAAAVLQHPVDNTWLRRCMTAAAACLSEMSPQSVSNILWALATISNQGPEQTTAVKLALRPSRKQIQTWREQQWKQQQKSLQQQQQPERQVQGDHNDIHEAADTSLQDTGLDVQQSWGMVSTTIDEQPQTWLDEMYSITAPRLADYPPASCAIVAWALAKMQAQPPPAWCSALRAATGYRLQDMASCDAVQLLWAMAKWDVAGSGEDSRRGGNISSNIGGRGSSSRRSNLAAVSPQVNVGVRSRLQLFTGSSSVAPYTSTSSSSVSLPSVQFIRSSDGIPAVRPASPPSSLPVSTSIVVGSMSPSDTAHPHRAININNSSSSQPQYPSLDTAPVSPHVSSFNSGRNSSTVNSMIQHLEPNNFPATHLSHTVKQQEQHSLASWAFAAVANLTSSSRSALNPTETSMALWALSQLQMQPSGSWLVSVLALMRTSLGQYSEQEAVGIVCAVARLLPLMAPHHRLQQQTHLWHIIWELARQDDVGSTAVARLLWAVSHMGPDTRQAIVWKLRLRMLQGLKVPSPGERGLLAISPAQQRRFAESRSAAPATSLDRRRGHGGDEHSSIIRSRRWRDSSSSSDGTASGSGSPSSAVDIVTSMCALVKLRHRLGIHALHTASSALSLCVTDLDPRGVTHAVWALARLVRDQPQSQLSHVGILLDALLLRLQGRQLLSFRISYVAAIAWGVATLHGLGARVRFVYTPRLTGLASSNCTRHSVTSSIKGRLLQAQEISSSFSSSSGRQSPLRNNSRGSSLQNMQAGSNATRAQLSLTLPMHQARLDACTAWLADCSRLIQPHIASMDAKSLSLILRALAKARVQPGHTFVESAAARSMVLLPSCQRHHLVSIAWALMVLRWSGELAWLDHCQAQWEQSSATSSSLRESAVMRQVLKRLRRRCQGSNFASLDLA